jgi:hypothetical protein
LQAIDGIDTLRVETFALEQPAEVPPGAGTSRRIRRNPPHPTAAVAAAARSRRIAVVRNPLKSLG